MSAFVCDNGTINRVISFMLLDNSQEVRRVILDETGCDIATTEGRQSLGEAMRLLNCKAVDARYGEGESKTFLDDLSYQFKSVKASNVQAYKSLRCWLYQCSEGDVPETSLLFSTMEKVAGIMAERIVQSLTAYDKAAWD